MKEIRYSNPHENREPGMKNRRLANAHSLDNQCGIAIQEYARDAHMSATMIRGMHKAQGATHFTFYLSPLYTTSGERGRIHTLLPERVLRAMQENDPGDATPD